MSFCALWFGSVVVIQSSFAPKALIVIQKLILIMTLLWGYDLKFKI